MMKEKIPHGNSMFPLTIHEIQTDIEFSERLNCHWHNEIEFLVVTKGEAVFYINERSYHVKEGDILFVHPNFLHSASAMDNCAFDFFAVVFSTSLLDSFLNDSIQQNYLSPIYHNDFMFNELLSSHDEWIKQIRFLLNKIRKLYLEQSICYELRIKACLFEIWSLLFSNSKNSDTLSKKDTDYRIERLKLVITYIEKNYASKIALNELASITGLCEGQFCRFFKLMTRMSAVDYLNHYRIMQSINLLTTTTKSISEIAGLCGFNNISYFNKTFLKYMHVTPSSYRKSAVD